MVELADGSGAIYTLPQSQVFEDRTPRLFDLAGTGKTNVITILTDVKLGASIAVFGVENGALKLIAQTPYIGRSNRWRNIAGIADFDGDGKIQIAEVITPHIGGTLNFWTWDNGNLKRSGEIYGFSNHVIGSTEQGLSAAEDFDNDGVIDLALPSDDRKKLKIVSFSGRANKKKSLNTIGSVPLQAPISKKISIFIEGDKPVVQFGLEDKTYWEVRN